MSDFVGLWGSTTELTALPRTPRLGPLKADYKKRNVVKRVKVDRSEKIEKPEEVRETCTTRRPLPSADTLISGLCAAQRARH